MIIEEIMKGLIMFMRWLIGEFKKHCNSYHEHATFTIFSDKRQNKLEVIFE